MDEVRYMMLMRLRYGNYTHYNSRMLPRGRSNSSAFRWQYGRCWARYCTLIDEVNQQRQRPKKKP